jgi:DNA replication and repair protein RecF
LNLRLTTPHARIRTVSLEDFRNYRSASIDLFAGQNVFMGANGQGKSNILEAIYALSSGRSFRGARDKDMIRHEAERAVIKGVVSEDDTEVALEYQRNSGRKAYVFDQKLPRVLDLVGRLPAVVFSTTDLAIIDGGPSERRAFLDAELALLSPSYLQAFAGYRKALEQRNAALRAVREGRTGADVLSPWETALGERGALVRKSRAEWLEALTPFVAREHTSLSGPGEDVEIETIHADEAADAEALETLLRERRQIDIAAGHTTVGPHRDDLLIVLNGQEARAFASQGQRRTIALALKLAVAHYWRERMNTVPLVLLDDIMSDLDSARRHAVMALSGRIGQVIITATDLDALDPQVRSDAKVFEVVNGEIHAK